MTNIGNKYNEKIPQYLYRGDSDPNGIRKLRASIHHNQFQTNLINGGQGRIIFERSLTSLIDRHVDAGWQKSHFLSFTEDINTAYRFGLGNHFIDNSKIENDYMEYIDDDENWLFALLTFNTENVEWKELGKGVYEGFYNVQLKKFKILSEKYRILLLDVVTVLSDSSDKHTYQQSITNATGDKEWLLFPATPILLNSGIREFSAILDGSIIDFQKIVRI